MKKRREDRRVLLFSIGAAIATMLVFGVGPAIAAARESVEGVLRSARSARGWRGRQALIVFQIALCTLLLACAGLLVRTFRELRAADTGFEAAHIATFSADPSLAGYTDEQAQALRLALMARVRELPGVASVATASRPLLRGSGVKTTVAPSGRRASRADFLNTSLNSVSPEYFDTLGLPILAGRGLAREAGKPVTVVVNEAFARRFFPEGNAVGKRFGNALDTVAGENFEIVGVVANAKYRSLREPMTPTFYQPQTGTGFFELLVRTRGRPEEVIQPVERALAALDPALPFTEVHTLAEEVDASVSGERLTAAVASLFGALAAVLAAVGLYGLLAYVVAQRRREIGIRMAVGARPGDIAAWISRQSLAMLAAGIIAGLAAAMAVAPAMQSLLYGVPPADPVSLAGAAAFVAVAVVVATAAPLARAVGVEPAAALRNEN